MIFWTSMYLKGRWCHILAVTNRAPSWIKISISNGDRHLHAITKVIMQKEKNQLNLKNTGTFLVFVAKAKVNTAPSRQREIIE